MDVSASARQRQQRENALARANQIRIARAKLKQGLRDGSLEIEAILACPSEHLASTAVVDLLLAVPKLGPVKATRLLRRARVSETKTVAQLSQRQRARLIELLTK